ncbi:MAG: hypothetical protein JOY84_14395 [Curvibacter sp.]|nr:hypothetical protein [Curvibacter sp.]
MLFLAKIHSSHADIERAPACESWMKKSLDEGDFSGTLICSSKDAALEKIGIAKSKTQSYLVYNYIYKFKAAAVHHGGQRVLIFSSKREYLGQYNISTPPILKVKIEKNRLVFFENKQPVGIVDLSSTPKISLINGDAVEFFK